MIKKHLTESTVLFISIIKWVFLATVAGAIVGGATSLFLKILNWATLVGQKSPYTFLFIPIAFFISALSIKYFAPEAAGHGTEKVIESIHKRSGKIAVLVVPVKLFATIITLATGGSAGKEGPCAQIGAGLTSLFSDLFKFNDHDRKKLVICGISAGFAAVFGTPIAGSIFGVEVLFVGSIMYEVLLPSFIAGITAYQVSSSFGITYFHQSINVIPVFSELFLIKVMLSGLFFGLCSIILIELLKGGDRLSQGIRIWLPLKGFIGGLLIIGFTYVFSAKYLGLGLETIEAGLRGQATDWYAFLVKPLFTVITLNFGGSGGIITPIFFTGVTAGLFFASIFSLNAGTFASIGLCSVLAGSASTPIAASIMSVELFGPAIAPYATVACIISFLITGHRSVYPSQVLTISKSPSLKVELGKELQNIHSSYLPRKKSLMGLILRLVNTIERLVEIMQGEELSEHKEKDLNRDKK